MRLWNITKHSTKQFYEYANILKDKDILQGNTTRHFLNACHCFIRYGSAPSEYLQMNLFKKSADERKKVLSFRKFMKTCKVCNNQNPEITNIVNNKYEFNKFMHKYINRQWLYSESSTEEELTNFLKVNKEVMYKPIDLYGGHGISKLHSNNQEDLKYLLDAKRENKKFLLEELIKQNDVLSKINPYSVNTVRVYSITDTKGDAHIIATYLRCATKNICVDNFSSGGIAFPIDKETGIISGPGRNELPVNEYIKHPLTNEIVLGTQIPMFDVVKNQVKEMSKDLSAFRFIGWDIAICDDHLELVEANLSPCNIILEINNKGNGAEVLKYV